jgi:hypothetical protein
VVALCGMERRRRTVLLISKLEVWILFGAREDARDGMLLAALSTIPISPRWALPNTHNQLVSQYGRLCELFLWVKDSSLPDFHPYNSYRISYLPITLRSSTIWPSYDIASLCIPCPNADVMHFPISSSNPLNTTRLERTNMKYNNQGILLRKCLNALEHRRHTAALERNIKCSFVQCWTFTSDL